VVKRHKNNAFFDLDSTVTLLKSLLVSSDSTISPPIFQALAFLTPSAKDMFVSATTRGASAYDAFESLFLLPEITSEVAVQVTLDNTEWEVLPWIDQTSLVKYVSPSFTRPFLSSQIIVDWLISTLLDLLSTSDLGADYYNDGVDNFIVSLLNHACSSKEMDLTWSKNEASPSPPQPTSIPNPSLMFHKLTNPANNKAPHDPSSIDWKIVVGSLLILKKSGKKSYRITPSQPPSPLSTLLNLSTLAAASLPKSEKSYILRFLGAVGEVWLAGVVYGGETGIILKGCHCLKIHYGQNLDMERAERIVRGLEVEDDWIEVAPTNQDNSSTTSASAAHSAIALLNDHVLSIRTFNDFSTSFSTLSSPPVALAVEIFLRVWSQISPSISILLSHIEKSPKLGVAAFCRCLMKIDKNGKTLAEACNVHDEVLLAVTAKCVGVNGAVE